MYAWDRPDLKNFFDECFGLGPFTYYVITDITGGGGGSALDEKLIERIGIMVANESREIGGG